MLNNLFRGPRAGLLLLSLVLPALVFVTVLLADIGQAPAQVQTLYYQGQAFNSADCTPDSSHTCEGGNVSGSVTLIGLPSGYSGTVTTSSMSSLGFTANGLTPTLGLGDPGGTIELKMTSGVLTGWSIILLRNSADPIYQIDTTGGSEGGPDDLGWLQYSSPFHVYYGANTAAGHWSNPKSLGKPCDHSGGCGTGEPIDLGSGNMFYQATDYETAGQNKLSLIRYYNSMAVPDTYAVSMGSNWRTNYDRYLHIFSTGIEAERPDGAIINWRPPRTAFSGGGETGIGPPSVIGRLRPMTVRAGPRREQVWWLRLRVPEPSARSTAACYR